MKSRAYVQALLISLLAVFALTSCVQNRVRQPVAAPLTPSSLASQHAPHNAEAHKPRTATASPITNPKPVASPALPPAAKEELKSDTLIEDAVLCKTRISLVGYEKYLRDEAIISGEAKDPYARLFFPLKAVGVLGKQIQRFMLAGDDESDYVQFLVLVNSPAETLASLVRSRKIKLFRHKGGYKSSRQNHGVVLISGQGKSATISCGHNNI